MPRWTATYGYVMLGFVLYALVVGFAAPALVSQRDTFPVVLGLVLLVALPPVLLALTVHWRKTGEGRRAASRRAS